MTQKQATELIIKNAIPYFNERGWEHKKVRRNEAIFINTTTGSINKIGISTSDYNPEQLIGFGIGKRIEEVEEIMVKINEKIPFSNPPYTRDENTLYLLDKGNSLNREDKSYCTTEEDIVYNLNKIYDYLDNYALPLLESFNDLREIDKLINGEGENFWEDDWKKPFNLAGRFYLRRLIIAKLSGRKDYNEFIENHITKIEKLSKEQGEKFDRNDLTDELVYCIHLLKTVEPLKPSC